VDGDGKPIMSDKWTPMSGFSRVFEPLLHDKEKNTLLIDVTFFV
jgi:hypothetical protein